MEEQFISRVKQIYAKSGLEFGYTHKKEFHEFKTYFQKSYTEDNVYNLYVHYPDKTVVGSKWKEINAEHRFALVNNGFSEFILFNDDLFRIQMTYKQIVDGIFEERTDIEAVSDKIQKLLALSESSNEHEAKLAAMKAQELIAQYGYSENDDGVLIHCIEMQFFKYPKLERELVSRTCASYRTRAIYFSNNQTPTHFEVFGTKTDLHVYLSVINYLIITAWKRARYMTKPTDYYKGFIHGVSQALEEQCVALQLVVPQEVHDKVNEKYGGKLRTTRGVNLYDNHGSSSWTYGEADGRSAMQSRQIE